MDAPTNVGAAVCVSFSGRETCRKFQETGHCSSAHPNSPTPPSNQYSPSEGDSERAAEWLDAAIDKAEFLPAATQFHAQEKQTEALAHGVEGDSERAAEWLHAAIDKAEFFTAAAQLRAQGKQTEADAIEDVLAATDSDGGFAELTVAKLRDQGKDDEADAFDSALAAIELVLSLRRTRLPDSCSPVFRPNGVSQDEAAPAHARGEAYENSSEYNLMFEYDVTSVILPRPQDRNATCGFNNAERELTTERRWWVEAKNQDTKSG